MNMLISFIKYFGRNFVRNAYWLYNTFKIRGGRKSKIHFPIIVEGNGKIKFGEKISIAKNCEFKVGFNTQLSLDDYSILGSDVSISISNAGSLRTGKNFSVEKGSRLIIHTAWIFGDRVRIATNCAIFSREYGYFGKLLIDQDSVIGDNSIIDVTDDVIIGKNVAIGPRVIIYTHDHDYMMPNLAAPWKGAPIRKPVIIEDGAWVGADVIILPGVRIGKNAILAAGAVVTKNIPSGSLCGGVPSKIIKLNYLE